MGKKIYKIIKWTLGVILILIILFLSVYLIKKKYNKEPVTKILGYSFFYVETGSMEPIINVGDLVIVKEFDSDYYFPGMDITYLREGAKSTVTHRIVKREGDIITTRGMNSKTNNTDDESFHVSCVVGEVIGVWDEFYKFQAFIKKPIGTITLLAIGIIIIEGVCLLDKLILKEDKQKSDNKENISDNLENQDA